VLEVACVPFPVITDETCNPFIGGRMTIDQLPVPAQRWLVRADSELAGHVSLTYVTRQHGRCVGRVQLLVDNGYAYEAHGNEFELHNYRQLEAE